MLIFKTQDDLKKHLSQLRLSSKSIAFIPTMGALHEGHLSLIEAAKQEADIVVCSIFVNPTQFNDPQDLDLYPQPIQKDITLLTDLECDILFLPDQKEMYPNGLNTHPEHEQLGYLDEILEAEKRPGHFQGVVHIMKELLGLILPNKLFMGQKDFQQCLIIQQLIEKNQWNCSFRMMPILREGDGLAMSSRNQRLNEFERVKASLIYQCLVSIKAKQSIGSFKIMAKESRELMERKGLKVEYITLANASDLTILEEFEEHTNMVVLIAAFLGDVRLIDNILLQDS